MDIRTLALAVGVFCATFLVGWWFNIGGLATGVLAARPAPEAQAPAAQSPTTTGQRVAVQTPQSKVPTKAWQGPGLVKDKLLRDALVSWAEKYEHPPCNQDVRWGYTKTATEYAEALMRSAGCNNFPHCPMSMGQLARVWEANRSALDRPVAEAMAAAHGAGGLSERAFRGDVGRAVQVIAGRDFDPGPAPVCSTRSNRTWSFRVRGRR